MEANARPGSDSIVLPAGTFTLTRGGRGEDAAVIGDLDITEDLTLTGAGVDQTIIDGNQTDRIFDVLGSVKVALADMTLRRGGQPSGSPLSTDQGGAVQNRGELFVLGVKISDSVATDGAAIANGAGTVRMVRSTLEGNGAFSLSPIFNAAGATMHIEDSLIRRGYGGCSGAISNQGTMTIQTTEISQNNGAGAGAICNYPSGTLTIDRSLLSDNGKPQSSGFRTTSNGGAIHNGSLFQRGGVLRIINSTLSDNAAEYGGGLFVASGSADLINVTLSRNSATTSGGGVYVDPSATLMVLNTIIATSQSGGDCAGRIISGGFNLIQDVAGCTIQGSTTGNILGRDPLLGSLADNSGPTRTHALLPGSPAIDAVLSGCPPPDKDQRGQDRPQDGDGDGTARCDVGAFEAKGIRSAPVLPTSKDQCKDGGWKQFRGENGKQRFKNQGQCVSYVETHGEKDKR
jgi:predicted outer membrane repeat protein